jgi:hypothetical protein
MWVKKFAVGRKITRRQLSEISNRAGFTIKDIHTPHTVQNGFYEALQTPESRDVATGTFRERLLVVASILLG